MKIKKKIICFFMFLICIVPSYSAFGRGSSGSLKQILRLLASIEKASGNQGISTLAEIQSKLELIQQTEMQIRQLQMEVENFRQLGKEIGHMDIVKINDLLERTLGFKDYANTTARDMEKKLDTFFSDYGGNLYKIYDKVDIDVLKRQREKLREQQNEMQKAVYNNMAKNQMYSNINDQGEELKRKVNTLNNVTGTLQAIQAIGGILEQTNSILLETKQMLATNMEMKDRIEAQVKKEEEIAYDNKEAIKREEEVYLKEYKSKKKNEVKKTKFKIAF